MLLADIGNTHIHLYDGMQVKHLRHQDAIIIYAQESLFYISVNQSLEEKITTQTQWKNISSLLREWGILSGWGIFTYSR